MNPRQRHIWAGLVICCFLVGCADFDRKMDVALYGSVEEADAVRAQSEAKAQTEFAKTVAKYEYQLMIIVNGERRKNRSQATTSTDQLQSAARARVREVAGRYSDRRPSGQDFSTIFDEHGIDRPSRTIKSLIKGTSTGSRFRELRASGPKKPIEVFQYWMSRTEDRNVLLKADLFRMAAATCLKDGTVYWVLLAYY